MGVIQSGCNPVLNNCGEYETCHIGGVSDLSATPGEEAGELWEVSRQIYAWAKTYEGNMREDQKSGFPVRHGRGVQRWTNNMLYNGQWRNNIPDGEGTMWHFTNDLEALATQKPVYTGHWSGGYRHGAGELRWSRCLDKDEHCHHALEKYPSLSARLQEVGSHAEGKMSCVEKKYAGEFLKGSFCGQGKLSVLNLDEFARAGNSWRTIVSDALAEACGDIAPPASRLLPPISLDPELLVDFDGVFTEFQTGATDPVCTETPMEDWMSGMKPPDDGILMSYRSQQGADTALICQGTSRYLGNSVYNGSFSKGWPEGKGEFLWYKEDVTDSGFDWKNTQWTCKYSGEWRAGSPAGQGELRTKSGFLYKGGWQAGRRQGTGRQVVPQDSCLHIGYRSYDGQWDADLWHGDGTLLSGEDEEFCYQGSLVNGIREGPGKLRYRGTLLYNGHWARNTFYTRKDTFAWMNYVPLEATANTCPEGQIYYGNLTPDGQRNGIGTLFFASAMDDPDFLCCMEAGVPFGEDPRSDRSLRYLVYHGDWVNNVKHGEGFQNIQGEGTYEGQFVHGRRHGRGVYVTSDKEVKYMPVPGVISNWDNDEMHGVAVVENSAIVHSNVIFSHGQCSMELDDLRLPYLSRRKDTDALGTRMRDSEVFPAFQRFLGLTCVDIDNDQQVHSTCGNSTSSTPIEESSTNVAIADLEDILIFGSGDAYCDGYFFKLWQQGNAFLHDSVDPHRLYRRLQNADDRYLFYQRHAGKWALSSSLPGSHSQRDQSSSSAEYAFAEDDAMEPHAVSSPWCRPAEVADSPSICCLTIRSVIGLLLVGIPKASELRPVMFQRCCRELAGRPVYRSETGEHYLYWAPKHGSTPHDGNLVKGIVLLSANGHWIISSVFNEGVGGIRCLAYVEDAAGAPHLLSQNKGWQVRTSESNEFILSDSLKLIPQEWNDDSDSEGGESCTNFESG